MAEPKLFQEINELQDKSVVTQATPPAGILEGRLWVDTSDSAYQGTVFSDFDSNKTTVEQQFKDAAVMHWMGGI